MIDFTIILLVWSSNKTNRDNIINNIKYNTINDTLYNYEKKWQLIVKYIVIFYNDQNKRDNVTKTWLNCFIYSLIHLGYHN